MRRKRTANVSVSWLARRYLGKRGSKVFVWGHDLSGDWAGMRASQDPPADIEFPYVFHANEIRVYLDRSVSDFAGWHGVEIGYRAIVGGLTVAHCTGSAG